MTIIVALLLLTLQAHNSIEDPTLEEILEVDRWAREYVKKSIK